MAGGVNCVGRDKNWSGYVSLLPPGREYGWDEPSTIADENLSILLTGENIPQSRLGAEKDVDIWCSLELDLSINGGAPAKVYSDNKSKLLCRADTDEFSVLAIGSPYSCLHKLYEIKVAGEEGRKPFYVVVPSHLRFDGDDVQKDIAERFRRARGLGLNRVTAGLVQEFNVQGRTVPDLKVSLTSDGKDALREVIRAVSDFQYKTPREILAERNGASRTRASR